MIHRGRSRSPTVRIGLESALDAIRTSPTTAILLGFTLLGALSGVIPVATLFSRSDGWLEFRPTVQQAHAGDLGLPWLMGVAGPIVAQREAVSILGSLILYALWATLGVAILTLISIGAARANQGSSDRRVRRAVGASRRMLLAAALAESGAIAVLPLVLGGLTGLAAARAIAQSWPGSVAGGTGAVAGFATVLLLVVFAAVLLVPALMRRRRIGEVELHRALPTTPVVFQIAAGFIVLSAGAMLTGRAGELLTPGASAAAGGSIAAVSVDAGTARERSASYDRLLEGLEVAGLDTVSVTSPGTLAGLGYVATVVTDCGRCTEGGLWLPIRLKPATHHVVSSDTFRLIGLPLLAGRGITPADDWNAPRVAVVSRSLAGREFQNGQPIGRRIHTGDDDPEGSTVVGVVEDRSPTGLGGTVQPRYAVYVSVLQHPPRAADLLVRDPADPAILDRLIRSLLPHGSRGYAPQSEQGVREADVASVLWFGRRFEVQGWATIGLAALGILAFMGLWVRSLEGEIGIRRSVGARRGRIFLWMVGHALGIALKGVAAGLWFGIALWRALPTAVAGAASWDVSQALPYAFAIVLGVTCSVLLPAWRASRAPLIRSY
ncbi:MAG: ABC transporter permease [Gemmatimonadales bacterium]|nr:ABC transporter permease [Gemmatimonadales bacterium]MBA3554522.1 ABC transporter permease [Gemmatimonadales bacterium]